MSGTQGWSQQASSLSAGAGAASASASGGNATTETHNNENGMNQAVETSTVGLTGGKTPEMTKQEIKVESKPHVTLPSISDLSGESAHNGKDGLTSSNTPLRLPSVQSTYGSKAPGAGQEVNGTIMESTVNPAPAQGRQNSVGLSFASFDNPLPPQQQTILSSSHFQVLPPHQQQQEQQQQMQQQMQHDAYYRPLNVKDALSYLEQVKYQFNSRPDVYNHFLDIMKDFKSQAIDTPGVIDRVSTLFKGYPGLIQGFNTFLPQGYRIECSANPDEPIRVTTPMGSSSVAGTIENAVAGFPAQPRIQQLQQLGQQQEQSLPEHVLPGVQVTTSATTTPTLNNQQPQPQPRPQLPADYQLPLQPAAGQQSQLPSNDQGKKTADVEFSQAINYVNKIKNRFAEQPDIYKHFLEILQTYQREQKPINEVYAQVTVLFQNAPDLLDDFKKFLPDSSPSANRQQQQPGVLQQQSPAFGLSAYYNETSPPTSRQNLPPLGSFSPPPNGAVPHNYYRDQQPQTLGLPPVAQVENHIDQRSPPHIATQGIAGEPMPVSNLRSQITAQSPSELAQLHQQQQIPSQPTANIPDGQYLDIAVRPEIDLDPSIVPVVPEPTAPIEDSLTLVEETSFFDRAKKFIGNKQIYTEFLKILNLFSQDLLDVDELVGRVEHYLGGNKELFVWFKNFVGFQDKPKDIENIVHEKHRLDLDLCEACGPSYKKLPKSDTFMPCSGRDEMCWAVLNDEWVGHPVWASEDSGFIAHRKNQYEETLFKIEEERHEYDFYIESNLRTIQTLETIASKIANMSEEEKATFKLPPGLGHTSLTIYKKVIRKVYDKERGFEIIDALHEYPAIAVPVVLKRLKQKDEEWRRAQREWNKVWRELEQKVYYKSLDHLGLTFKQADKKLLTTKQLISEIGSIKTDQTNKRMHWLTPKPKDQLDYYVPDKSVFFDILSLTDTFINHNSSYSNPDKIRLKDLFKIFVSLFFSIPMYEVNEAVSRRGNLDDDKEDSTQKMESDNLNNSKRPREDEISLSEVLHRAKNQRFKSRAADETSEESAAEPEPELNEEEETIRQEAKKPWLLGNLVEEVNAQGLINNRKTFNMFANTNIYVFFRHLTTLYERLEEVKKMNDAVTKEINSRKVVQFAKDLNLISQQLKEMGLDFEGADAYEQLRHLCKRLIEGDIEHQWFEESLRQAYNNKAFKLYTVDKVIQSLVKHAHTILTDSKTSEIMTSFEKDRTQINTSAKDQILYRLQVRSYMSSTENMFRIEYNKESKNVRIQFIAVDDLTLAEPRSLEEKWRYYVTSYSLSHPTEGISQEELQLPFLEKVLETEEDYGSDVDNFSIDKFSPEGVSKSTLKIKIDPETYLLDIEAGSYDVFSRKSVNRFPVIVDSNDYTTKKEKKKNMVIQFLESKKGWKKNLDDDQVKAIQEKLARVKENGSLDDFNEASQTQQASEIIAPSKVEQSKESTVADVNSLPKELVEAEDRGNDTTADEVDPEVVAH